MHHFKLAPAQGPYLNVKFDCVGVSDVWTGQSFTFIDMG